MTDLQEMDAGVCVGEVRAALRHPGIPSCVPAAGEDIESKYAGDSLNTQAALTVRDLLI